jgi:hypothetical protein
MGIGLAPGAAPAGIQVLAKRARAGDKQAQLDLGIAFDEGREIAQDCRRARKLYRLAATASGGTIFVYQPPARKGGRGMVVPVNMGPRVAGLEEARRRLKTLDSNGGACGHATTLPTRL